MYVVTTTAVITAYFSATGSHKHQCATLYIEFLYGKLKVPLRRGEIHHSKQINLEDGIANTIQM